MTNQGEYGEGGLVGGLLVLLVRVDKFLGSVSGDGLVGVGDFFLPGSSHSISLVGF